MADISPATKKRRRPALACIECRRRKVKCDRNHPCRRCIRNSVDCAYAENPPVPKTTRVSRRARGEEAVDAEHTVGAGAHQSPDRPSIGESIGGVHIRNIRSTIRRIPARGSPSNGVQNEPVSEEPAVRTWEGSQPRTHAGGSKTSKAPSHNATVNSPIHGTFSKTRVFGPSHWMSSYPETRKLPALHLLSSLGFTPSQQDNTEPNPEIRATVIKCKQLARQVKTQRPSRSPLPAGMFQTFPSPSVTRDLLGLYFHTFESCYRILHSPSFYAEYEGHVENLEGAPGPFILKLSLVMAVVAPIVGEVVLRQDLRKSALDWIDIAQTWLSGPIEKNRLTLDGLQIHCLLLLARQTNYVGADLTWISAGCLIRMAMQMGLHHDPNNLGEMPVLEKELRRRLWYTILEINVQSSLDAGMIPMVSADGYDTQLPLNIDDDDLVNTPGIESAGKESAVLTQASFQRLLACSLPLRLKVVEIMNDLQKQPSYDEVLRLGNEMMSTYKNAAVTINQYRSLETNLWLSEFPHNLCDHYHRRLLLLLHRPFAAKAYEDPIYSHSAEICLENALSTISLLDDEIYHRLMVVGGGMFREILTDSALMIFLELTSRFESDNAIFSKSRNKARREPLLQDARKIVEHGKDRLLNGETNVKILVYFSVAMAQIDAIAEGSPVRDAVNKAAIESLRMSYDILKSRAESSSSVTHTQFDLDSWTADNAILTPSAGGMDFDFLTEFGMGLDQLGSSFFQQWQEHAQF
ncbi:transcriptional regulator family: Fungal Specific TF [Paecilomyces variotii]|nr:transcriptional regulator family: Fungal Specific TF [Paecilomyces variotii]